MRRLRELCQLLDPELLASLEQGASENMFFTYRWFVVDFKRECSQTEVCALIYPRPWHLTVIFQQMLLTVWERLWAGRWALSIHLPVALAYVRLADLRSGDCRAFHRAVVTIAFSVEESWRNVIAMRTCSSCATATTGLSWSSS